MTQEEILKHAFKAMDNAYAPYSNYHVGACVACKDGSYFYGANIENASYGATNCGERSAVFAAYSNGKRKDDIEALAIVTDGGRVGAPCGVCRQVMMEFCNYENFKIILANGEDQYLEITLKELCPWGFGPDNL